MIGSFAAALHPPRADTSPPRRRLRARRKRPRRRAADERDEVAPFHCPMPPVLPTERIAHLGPAGGAALRDFDPAYVADGSHPRIAQRPPR